MINFSSRTIQTNINRHQRHVNELQTKIDDINIHPEKKRMLQRKKEEKVEEVQRWIGFAKEEGYSTRFLKEGLWMISNEFGDFPKHLPTRIRNKVVKTY